MRISDWSSDVCSSDLKQGLTEGRVSGGVEVDAREDVAADHIGREALAILRIIAPQRQRQAVGDVEIDGAEDRESLVLHFVAFVEAVSGAEEGIKIFRRIAFERAKRAFKIGRASCRERVCQYV